MCFFAIVVAVKRQLVGLVNFPAFSPFCRLDFGLIFDEILAISCEGIFGVFFLFTNVVIVHYIISSCMISICCAPIVSWSDLQCMLEKYTVSLFAK